MRLSFSHTPRALTIGLVALLLSGCSSSKDWYEANYRSSKESLGDLAYFLPNSPVEEQDVVIKRVTNWADWDKRINEVLEQGYIPIGSSETSEYNYVSYSLLIRWILAVDHAVDVGADLILIGKSDTVTDQKRIVTETFGSSTGTSYGYTTGNYYGAAVGGPHGAVGNSYGNATGWNNSLDVYSGTSITNEQSLYHHKKRAIFFRKGNFDSFYGAIIAAPHEMYPDETLDSPVTANVVCVIKGSQAERDGIRKGQRVLRLNGKPIETYRDLERIPLHAISSVEVEK